MERRFCLDKCLDMRNSSPVLEAFIDAIILRSWTLEERCKQSDLYFRVSDGCQVAMRRYADLKENLDIEADWQFKNYLRWSGYGDLRDLPLGDPRPGSRPLVRPSWASWLLFILQAHCKLSAAMASCSGVRSLDDVLLDCLDPETADLFLRIDRSRPQAAVELHALSVSLATLHLRERCGTSMALLESSALQGLQEHLWRLLNRLTESVFERAWKLHCFSESDSVVVTWPEGSLRATDAERTFLDWLLLGEGFQQLLLSHACLARVLACAIQSWVDDCADFIQRLDSDRHLIEETLLQGRCLNAVSRIEDGLSDSHGGARFVKKLSLKHGEVLIYKPRDCGALACLQQLLAYVRLHSSCSLHAVPPCLNRNGYGWVAFVDRSECTSEAEVRAYYERAGELLALLYLLRTNDAHYENVIATSKEPLLIDGDTILYPGFYDLTSTHLDAGPMGWSLQYCELAIEESVVSSGLLPMWDEINGLRDAGGFSDFFEAGLNFPTLKNKSAPIHGYVREVCKGYRRLCLFFAGSRRGELLKQLETFESCMTRPLYRSTRVYEVLRNQVLKPSRMIDGVARSVALERLKANHLRQPTCPLAWAIVEEEIRQLQNDDIPAFSVGCSSSVMHLPHGATLPLRSGLSIARERIRGLTHSRIQHHLEQIRASCFFSQKGQAKELAVRVLSRQVISQRIEVVGDTQLTDSATALIQKLTSRSCRSRLSGSSWVGIHVLEQSGCLQLAHAGLSLYDGNAGLLLLYAACAALKLDVGDGVSAMDMVRMTLQPISSLAEQPGYVARFAAHFGLGGVTGLGSIIYALSCSAQILRSDDLLNRAQALAAAISPAWITESSCSDVMAGLAGLLLSLLALYRCSGDERVLTLCRLCGDRLLTNAQPIQPGVLAWPNPSGRFLCGMSHGVAGIAMALSELSELLADPKYRQHAMAAIGFENQHIDSISGHWLDLRHEQPAVMNSWCNGAPGIGLARLIMLRLQFSEQLSCDLERAIGLVQRDCEDSLDQLCCGLMGHSELLLSAGLWFGRQDLIAEARTLAMSVVQHSGQRHQFRLLKGLRKDLSLPGFFQGTAGIAYELLRLANPRVLPSILALELLPTYGNQGAA